MQSKVTCINTIGLAIDTRIALDVFVVRVSDMARCIDWPICMSRGPLPLKPRQHWTDVCLLGWFAGGPVAPRHYGHGKEMPRPHHLAYPSYPSHPSPEHMLYHPMPHQPPDLQYYEQMYARPPPLQSAGKLPGAKLRMCHCFHVLSRLIVLSFVFLIPGMGRRRLLLWENRPPLCRHMLYLL